MIWYLIDVAKSEELKAQFSLDKQQTNDMKESQQKGSDESSKIAKEVVASASEATDNFRRRGSKRDRAIARRSLPENANTAEPKVEKGSLLETAAANNAEAKDEKIKDGDKEFIVNTVKEQLVVF